MPYQTSENRSKHFCKTTWSKWSDVKDPPSDLPCFNLFKAAETESAENEREAMSSTETSRSSRACANKHEELGMEEASRFLNLPAQSSTRF